MEAPLSKRGKVALLRKHILVADFLGLKEEKDKMVLSLLLEVATITDKIPSYEEFSEFVLFSDWEKNLRKYALNKILRQQHIQEGKKYIMSKYDRNRVISQWSSLFHILLHKAELNS